MQELGREGLPCRMPRRRRCRRRRGWLRWRPRRWWPGFRGFGCATVMALSKGTGIGLRIGFSRVLRRITPLCGPSARLPEEYSALGGGACWGGGAGAGGGAPLAASGPWAVRADRPRTASAALTRVPPLFPPRVRAPARQGSEMQDRASVAAPEPSPGLPWRSSTCTRAGRCRWRRCLC